MNDTPATRETASEGAVSRRLRVAEVLAFVAVVAALVGAVGPADRLSTTYSWPPPDLPESTPSQVWYTPLLLQRRFPESLTATLSCSPQPALAGAERPVTVLATARSPERAGGLALRQESDRLAVTIGHTSLAYLPLSRERANGDGCAYRLAVADGRWSVDGPTGAQLGGELVRMPVVNGLFSELDLRAGQPPAVEVRTEVHGADPIARQKIAWIVASLCVVIALLLAAVERRPRRPQHALLRTRRLLAHAHATDASVVVVLVVWWVVSPVFWDDGWAFARQNAFATTGSFSNYYESFGAALPLQFWLDWLQHWVTQNTTATLALRVPALICLLTTWLLCRWIVHRLLRFPGRQDGVVLWALAATFVVGAMAWGMTLRPEPVVALFVTAVMACSLRFKERPSPAPLAVAAILVPLAITAHPAGLVSIAPLIAVASILARWARSHPATAATMFASSLALVVILAFVGGDVVERSTDTQIIQEVSVTVQSWRDELNRYQRFTQYRTDEIEPYGTPLRRASLALIVLAIAAFAVRRGRRAGSATDDAPALALAISLLLLVGTPSKWPWHFGVLMGLAAIVIASETENLRAESRKPARSLWLGFSAIVASALAVTWSWSPQRSWNPLDLRTLEWTRPFDEFPALLVAIALPLLVLLALLLRKGRRIGQQRSQTVWLAACWSTPALLLPMVAFTVAFFIADAAVTRSWTFTRQTVESVNGSDGCGLADDVLVPNLTSVRSALPVVERDPPLVPEWVPPPPTRGLSRFALGPTMRRTTSTPWFWLPRVGRMGLFVAGTPGQLDQLTLDLGLMDAGRIRQVAAGTFGIDVTSQSNALFEWRFIPAGELPKIPEDVDAVRISLREGSPGAAVAVTSPLAYDRSALTPYLDDGASLVVSNLFMYFPCARLPRLSNGVGETPATTVITLDSWAPITFAESSPFAGALDLYPLRRIPLSDAENPLDGVSAFEIVRRIPGGRVAPPRMTSS